MANHIKSSPNGAPDEVDEWVAAVDKVLEKIADKIPKTRIMRADEETKWLDLLNDINTHITFCHDSIVKRSADSQWKMRLAAIEARII